VIPTGAIGVCVNPSDNNFVIDFGKGIVVPFEINNEFNRANNKIVVDERGYNIQGRNRKSRLYFNIEELRRFPSK
jgi:hypothetical protein